MAVNDRAPRNPDTTGEGEERRKPFAVEQADREVAAAQEALDRAKESGSQTAIDDAQEALDEAQAARDALRADTREGRREARREFMQQYYDEYGPYVAQLVKEDPELRDLFQQAVAEGWDAARFEDAIKGTDWWKDEGKTSAWMAAFQLEFGDAPGGEWEKTLADAAERVTDLARAQGIELSDDVVERIARRSLYEGWDDRDLREWMGDRVARGIRGDTYEVAGTIETAARTLRNYARDFGLSYSDEWFARRANNLVNRPEQYSQDDFVNQMISDAESLFPVLAGRLSADYTVRDAAGSYLAQMSNLLETDANQIDLSDPLLQRAFNSVTDDKGNPQMMSLWDFQKEVRKDDRWQYTSNAYQTYTNIGTGLARMMGFTG